MAQRRKKDWHVTTEDLIDALGPIGQEYAKPKEFLHKIDLSYTDALLAATDVKAGQEEAKKNASEAQKSSRFNLTGILTNYARYVAPTIEYHLRNQEGPSSSAHLHQMLVERTNDLKRLARKGWDITDLMNWMWILTASTAERGSARLALLAGLAFENKRGGRTIPQMILLFMLRRKRNTARGLKHLLVYAWTLMKKAETPAINNKVAESRIRRGLPVQMTIKHAQESPSGMQEDIFIIMIVRLLQRARELWPTACESITSLLCQYLDGVNFRHANLPKHEDGDDSIARLTFMYNSVLKLLAEPSSIHPFLSATHQQRAQFSVLRRMNDFEPPLVVDRRGYRAVTSMQLMHKKTLREREWAQLKAKSWPPWKEEKSGLDAHIGPEHGISRAKEVLNSAKEAGYASDCWEDAAALLSGWDVDGSPTIQSRRIFASPTKIGASDFGNATIWAARICATRTLDEAWAAFLTYQDCTKQRHGGVYKAMFEKIFWNAKSFQTAKSGDGTESADNMEALPGDGLEVFPAPTSPREALYVRSAPPIPESFFQSMIDDGIRPGPRFLTLLLRNASSLAVGIAYLERSTVPRRYQAALLQQEAQPEPGSDLSSALKEVPEYLFSTFINLLTRLAPDSSDKRPQLADVPSDFAYSPSLLTSPLSYAFRLMRCRAPQKRPAWYSLLKALSRDKVVVSSTKTRMHQHKQDIIAWHTSCGVIEWMDDLGVGLNLDAFHHLCVGLEKAIFATEKMLVRAGGMANIDSEIKPFAEEVLFKGPQYVNEVFKNLVRCDTMYQEVPHAVMEEKLRLDSEVEADISEANDEAHTPIEIDGEYEESSNECKRFLPPGCLLPMLVEVPKPAQLHAFIRVLGLRRDYGGLLDLVEWMALYADEIKFTADQLENGQRMFRRCLIAVRVFCERSWMYHLDQNKDRTDWIENDAEPASKEIWRAIHDTILERSDWGGWPTDDEIVQYILKGRFV